MKLFLFVCRSQAGRELSDLTTRTMAKDTFWTSCSWEVLLSEPQERLYPKCSLPWTVFSFLVGSQCRVAGEHFSPGRCTYETWALPPKPVCSMPLPGVKPKLGLYPVGILVSLLSTWKGLLQKGRRQAHPCNSPPAGGAGAAAVQKPARNQAGFEYHAPSWFAFIYGGVLKLLFYLGFIFLWGKVDFVKWFYRWESWVKLLFGLNYLWGWEWRPRSSLEHFLVTKWGLLPGSLRP